MCRATHRYVVTFSVNYCPDLEFLHRKWTTAAKHARRFVSPRRLKLNRTYRAGAARIRITRECLPRCRQ